MEKRIRLSLWGALRFCISFAFTLYLWFFFRSYLLFLILVLMVCSPAASLLLLWSCRDKLSVQALLPQGRVGKNIDFSFDIKVHNQSRFAVFTADVIYSWQNLFTGYMEQKKQHLWVAPGKDSEISQLLNSRFAGRVEVRIETFTVYDPLHMFCLQGCDREQASSSIWPSFLETDEEELYSFVDGFPKENEIKRRGTDYNPDYEIREYIAGDELKSIHWKLSAKQQKLMVRERLATGREKINVLLPLGDDSRENDSLMEAACALCRLLLKKEYPIQFYWPGRGEVLQGRFVAEQGEWERLLDEILSDTGFHPPGEAKQQMAAKCPGESYILIRTGAYKGEYIR